MKFDVIIIGGGPGGLAAGLWCDDLGLSALLLESGKEFGGQLLETHNPIENHLGCRAKNGLELRNILMRQIENRGFILRSDSEAVDINVEEKTVVLKNGDSFTARALIIATGVRRRKLRIDGEDEFKGKGVLTSGQLEKNSVCGKNVVIVGSGDGALENCLIFAESARHVFLVNRSNKFRARPEFVRRIQKLPNVTVYTETKLRKIIGKNEITAVELMHSRTTMISTLASEFVLIRIGFEPNTELLRGKVELDEYGYIVVRSSCETSVGSVYAIGDAANPPAPTISGAVGMAATAAKAIHYWLNN